MTEQLVDTKTKYLVFGFVRIIKINDKIIPIPIIELLIKFYYETEYFSKCGKYAVISNDKLTITNTAKSGEWSTCYGIQAIESNTELIHVWKIKINNSHSMGYISIGIDSSDAQFVDHGFLFKSSSENYCFRADGYKISKGVQIHGYCNGFFDNDVVEVIVNLSKAEISFTVNDKNQGVAYSNITKRDDIKYRLAVYTYKTNESVTLLDYSVKYEK